MNSDAIFKLIDRFGVAAVVSLSFGLGLLGKFLLGDWWGETILLVCSLLFSAAFIGFTLLYHGEELSERYLGGSAAGNILDKDGPFGPGGPWARTKNRSPKGGRFYKGSR